MKTGFCVFLCISCYALPAFLSAAEMPSGPYLGQELPGMTPEAFAPGLICLENRYEQDAAIAPDGNEFCFTVTDSGWSTSRAWHTRLEEGRWTTPRLAAFVSSGDVWGPHFSPDGEGFYFASSRPSYPPANLWKCARTPAGWSAPAKLDGPVSSTSDEWSCSLARDKTLYLCSHRPGGRGGCDIWYCDYLDGQYTQATNIAILNTNGNDCSPVVSPDGTFLVFNSPTRSGGYGGTDLYITFRREDGSWAAPRNLGPQINTSDHDMGLCLSADGKYAFFTRRTNRDSDIYWVDIRATVPEPNGPIENLSTGLRFGSIQCAINYASNGDQIALSPGTYEESIGLMGKDLVIRSADPNTIRPEDVIVQGEAGRPVVLLNANATLEGFTITGGSMGVECTGAEPSIVGCCIVENAGDGMCVAAGTHLKLVNSVVTANEGAAIKLLSREGRRTTYGICDIINCTIMQNGAPGIITVEPEAARCIVSASSAGVQEPAAEDCPCMQATR
jgi:hypothetical protein